MYKEGILHSLRLRASLPFAIYLYTLYLYSLVGKYALVLVIIPSMAHLWYACILYRIIYYFMKYPAVTVSS